MFIIIVVIMLLFFLKCRLTDMSEVFFYQKVSFLVIVMIILQLLLSNSRIVNNFKVMLLIDIGIVLLFFPFISLILIIRCFSLLFVLLLMFIGIDDFGVK